MSRRLGLEGMMGKRRMRTWLAIGTVIGMHLGGATAWAQEGKPMTPLEIPAIGNLEMLKPGERAPEFALRDLEGKSFDLEEQGARKVQLIVFWSIFCGPCAAEMPVVQNVYEEFREDGLQVLAISMDGEPMAKSVQGVVEREGYTFRVFIDRLTGDASYRVADPYGVVGTPTLYVVGRDGRVLFAELGKTPKETLEEVITSALAVP